MSKFLESPEKITELKSYLKLQPAVNSATHLCMFRPPLHLACLLHLFKVGTKSETLTELNEQFTGMLHTVYRHVEKQDTEPQNNEKFQDLLNHILCILRKLFDLAMRGLWQKK